MDKMLKLQFYDVNSALFEGGIAPCLHGAVEKITKQV